MSTLSENDFHHRIDLFEPGDTTALICADVPEVQRLVAPRGHISVARQQYIVGAPYVGRIVTARIEDTVVHCLLDGKIIKTFPRRHTGEVRRLNVDKKHKSRRAADARRRTAQADKNCVG